VPPKPTLRAAIGLEKAWAQHRAVGQADGGAAGNVAGVVVGTTTLALEAGQPAKFEESAGGSGGWW